ncbi:crotonase/enoyl-CoA hydratase family protein [Nocardia vaccinii]|uniref:crotonase/enoyl-CoA hydratase family protein n=1 Tax=Nocardia vaccinii TaxID=1822 RepID=UPI0008373963|nr:crotonase/enoyl-CoA hydratase family protein [Nocardia vaccinii]
MTTEANAPEETVLTYLDENIFVVALNRPEKRNAFSLAVLERLREVFADLPENAKAVVITAKGDHFCAGLDLAEHKVQAPFPSVLSSRRHHDTFNSIEFCGLPVITAMHGAVIGGGFELACATHIRVGEPDCFFQLPESRRGIFVGGGGTLRVRRLIGAGRMVEMMLTGRRYTAEEGISLGIIHYLAEPGGAFAKAMELARVVAQNAPISNYLILNAIAAIDDMPAESALYTEAVSAALTLTSADAQQGIDAFLNRNRD